MFTIVPNGPNRVDIMLNGKLDSEQMKIALDDLVEKTANVQNGRMLYRIHDFKLPSLAAIGVEFARLPKMFGLISKFERCAVLADQEWIRKIGELEGKLIPGLEIKGFDLEDEAGAEAWLAEN